MTLSAIARRLDLCQGGRRVGVVFAASAARPRVDAVTAAAP